MDLEAEWLLPEGEPYWAAGEEKEGNGYPFDGFLHAIQILFLPAD